MDTILTNLYAGILVALGIGFVIFIHELGHFLAAKWAGVKVEKFAIGFGPVLCSYRKGVGFRLGSTMKEYAAALEAGGSESTTVSETEYSLRALPLGGYVKMLGEDPGGEVIKSSDPRAFPNRPVGARMVIISAGVVMNIILGFCCYVAMYMLGVEDVAPVLGTVVPEQPAYEAGFRPGDTVVAIDGHRDVTFTDLQHAVAFSGTGQRVHFEVKHLGSDTVVPIDVEPRRGDKSMSPTIGVTPGPSLTLYQDPKIPGGLGSSENTKSTITAVGPVGSEPVAVANIEDLHRALIKYRDEPLTVVVERSPLWDRSGPKTVEKGTVPATQFRDFGMKFAAGPISAVRPGSPASVAGFRKGDRIVSVDDHADFDPMQLPELAAASAGKAMTFEVRRGTAGKDEETVKLTPTPDDSPQWVFLPLESMPLDIPGLGLALPIVPKVVTMTEGSPADKAGIKSGDVIESILFPTTVESKVEAAKPEFKWEKKKTALLSSGGVTWPAVFSRLQASEGPVRLAIAGKKDEVELIATPVKGWSNPLRELGFVPQLRWFPPQSLGEAIRRAGPDTRESALSFYAVLRNLTQGRQSPMAFISPVKIVDLAFSVAKYSEFSNFLRLIGMISINLAVVNFLPIPPLDGGQMVFLIAEKVRGRPLPDDAVLWPTLIGVAFVLTLFAAVLIKDLWSYF